MIPLMQRKLLLICVGVEGVSCWKLLGHLTSQRQHIKLRPSSPWSALKQCCGNRQVARKQTAVHSVITLLSIRSFITRIQTTNNVICLPMLKLDFSSWLKFTLPARHLYRIRQAWGLLHYSIYNLISDSDDLNGEQKKKKNKKIISKKRGALTQRAFIGKLSYCVRNNTWGWVIWY